MRPPIRGRVDAQIEVDLRASHVAQGRLDLFENGIRRAFGHGHLGAYDPLRFRHQTAEGADHVGQCEKTAVGGREPDEVCAEAGETGLVEDGADGGFLLLTGENRAANEASQIGALLEKGIKALHGRRDRFDLALVAGQLEQCGGIATCYACNRGTRLGTGLRHAPLSLLIRPEVPARDTVLGVGSETVRNGNRLEIQV